jgi:hypothetical protein
LIKSISIPLFVFITLINRFSLCNSTLFLLILKSL